jgi:Uma2 family endonuclease
MGHPFKKTEARYSWDDYQSWSDDQRYELVGGEPFAMSPSPGSRHQRIARRLSASFESYFEGKRCEHFFAPFDVKLSDKDIVQPDLFVVCNKSQIKRTHIEGAPALVVEIISPSSAAHDRIRKMDLYARFGVKEVWLATPYPPMVEIFLLDGASYRRVSAFQKEDELVSATFPELRIPLEPVFDYPPDPDDPPLIVSEIPAMYRAKTADVGASS